MEGLGKSGPTTAAVRVDDYREIGVPRLDKESSLLPCYPYLGDGRTNRSRTYYGGY